VETPDSGLMGIAVVNLEGLKMQAYRDWDQDSGITHYEILEDSILIKFRGGNTYQYHESCIGLHHLKELKQLAANGDGLNKYINQNSNIKKCGKKTLK
jgi:hypothetical protein